MNVAHTALFFHSFFFQGENHHVYKIKSKKSQYGFHVMQKPESQMMKKSIKYSQFSLIFPSHLKSRPHNKNRSSIFVRVISPVNLSSSSFMGNIFLVVNKKLHQETESCKQTCNHVGFTKISRMSGL